MIGSMHAASFAEDPKHLGFVLARYKFVAKMFAGFHAVLEVGCGDCTGATVVKQAVSHWHGCDIHPLNKNWQVFEHDMLLAPVSFYAKYDGIYALDVLEHIEPKDEDKFLKNICGSLTEKGSLIIGMPSLESQQYASLNSKMQHVNCKTEIGLRETLARYFTSVFLFGMNDETLTTGFGPMCHYRLAVCAGKL